MKPARRFWKETAITPADGGYSISLDGRGLRTPSGGGFLAPTMALAEVIRNECDSQGDEISPETMPMFQFTVTAIDRITPRRDAIIDEISQFGGSDLLCYREDRDERLKARQDEIWQPYLNWLAGRHGAELVVVSGIMPQPQRDEALAVLRGAVAHFDDYNLAGLHSLVTISGSLVLGLAMADGHASAEDGGRAALLDELWQQEKWGYDEDADKRIKSLAKALIEARQYMDLLAHQPGEG